MRHYYKFVFLFITILTTSCSTSNMLVQKSIKINPGMSKEEVVAIMGSPSNRQFKTTDSGIIYEAVQWDCGWHSGMTSEFSNKDMLIVYFKNGKVTDLNNYVAYNGQVIIVKWEERPDFVIENRNR
jgi:outer membrane protein assembly factor BamE (lipoprotein component of BamABCDE complex)